VAVCIYSPFLLDCVAAGVDQVVTLPKRYALKTTEEYRITVRCWDTNARTAIAGDQDYDQARRDFHYDKTGGGIDPVINLTATPQDAGSPGVTLDFHRAVDPEHFTIKRDGKEIADKLEPDDLRIAGDHFQYIDWSAKPRSTHTYEVEAREHVTYSGWTEEEEGASEDNDTDMITTAPWGVWLIDEEDNLAVQFVGDDEMSMSIRRVLTEYDIPKRRDSVMHIDVIGGYMGTYSGDILDKQPAADFEDLIGRTPKNLRLVFADKSFLVQLPDGAPSPTPIGDGKTLYRATFDWKQVAEWTFKVPHLGSGQGGGGGGQGGGGSVWIAE